MTKQETINFIKNLIKTGEKIDVEFKESKNDLNKDVYESVCSFNNRDGGYIILGVVDKTKEICGVNPDKVDKMRKDFTTSINNANKINLRTNFRNIFSIVLSIPLRLYFLQA